MLAYFAMIVLSVSYAMVTEFAFNTAKLVFGYVLLCVMIARLVTTEARLMGVIGTLLAAHMFLLAMNPVVITDPQNRNYVIGATFLGDGNDFSLSLVVLLPCAVELALRVRSFFLRILVSAAAVMSLLAIVASQSRGATIGIACIFMFMWWKSPRKIVSLVMVAIAALIMLAYAPPEYFNRMNTMADYKNEGSAMARIIAWKTGVRMAVDNPLLGVGTGNFPVAYGTKYKPPEAINAWKTAHSIYFLVLGELGFTGIILLLGLIFSNILQNERVRKAIEARAGPKPPLEVKQQVRQLNLFTCAVIGFASAGAFLSAAYYPHIFVLTGLLIAARAIALQRFGLQWSLVTPVTTRRRPGLRQPTVGQQ
jgi:probable O-glycosylation ligase (exosortase A-associated)